MPGSIATARLFAVDAPGDKPGRLGRAAGQPTLPAVRPRIAGYRTTLSPLPQPAAVSSFSFRSPGRFVAFWNGGIV